jgi:thiol peroxidase
VVVNKDGEVIYTEQVGETGDEPDYDAALASLS